MSTAPKKSLGQHWLFDEQSLEAMMNAGEVRASDVVVEVGPGLGPLTQKLCAEVKEVVAVELDDILAANLHQNVQSRNSSASLGAADATGQVEDPTEISVSGTGDKKIKNLTVVHQSILDFDTTRLPKGYKVIANIPYYLTSNLIRRMLESPNPPSLMVLLVQKEVAERVAAGPGNMGILSVATQYYAEVSLKELVPAELFTPPPKVDSQIIQIRRRTVPLFANVDTELFFKLVRAGFSEKRKKLRSALSGGLQISKAQADNLLQSAEISSDARAQELTLHQWHQLYLQLSTLSS